MVDRLVVNLLFEGLLSIQVKLVLKAIHCLVLREQLRGERHRDHLSLRSRDDCHADRSPLAKDDLLPLNLEVLGGRVRQGELWEKVRVENEGRRCGELSVWLLHRDDVSPGA